MATHGTEDRADQTVALTRTVKTRLDTERKIPEEPYWRVVDSLISDRRLLKAIERKDPDLVAKIREQLTPRPA
jgi:hypothetical protein